MNLIKKFDEKSNILPLNGRYIKIHTYLEGSTNGWGLEGYIAIKEKSKFINDLENEVRQLSKNFEKRFNGRKLLAVNLTRRMPVNSCMEDISLVTYVLKDIGQYGEIIEFEDEAQALKLAASL